MGTVLFPGLGPGLGTTINPFDPDYEHQLLVANNQKQADDTNARNIAAYQARAAQLKAENVQQAANHLPLLTLDPPPHKKVLDANGNIVDSTDLVCAAISVIPDAATGPATSPTGAFPVNPSVVDRTDIALAMLRVLKQDIDAIKAKLGA